MAPIDYATATGASGKSYRFQVYPLDTHFHHGVGGLYAFCSRAGRDWTFHYVGQAECLQARVGSGLSNHHKITAAKRLGATHVAVIAVPGGVTARCRAEGDLVRRMKPRLNEIAPPDPLVAALRARRNALS
jgi:hypothetical protein